MKVALDIDGVLADFYLGICRAAKMPYVMTKYNVKWINEHFHKIENDAQFWRNLPVLSPPESIGFEFDLYLTSSPKIMTSVRHEWLMHHGFPDKPVVHSKNKAKYCVENDVDLLIDDHFENVEGCVISGVSTLLFLPPYIWHTPMSTSSIRSLAEVSI